MQKIKFCFLFSFFLIAFNPYYINTYLIGQFQTGGLVRVTFGIVSLALFGLFALYEMFNKNKFDYLYKRNFISISMLSLLIINCLVLISSINTKNYLIAGTDFFPIFILTLSYFVFLIILSYENNFKLLYYSLIFWALIIVLFDSAHYIISFLLNYSYARMHVVDDYSFNRLPDLSYAVLMSLIVPFVLSKKIINLILVIQLIILSSFISIISLWKTLMLSGIIMLLFGILLFTKKIKDLNWKIIVIIVTLSATTLLTLINTIDRENFSNVFEERILVAADISEVQSRTYSTRIEDWLDTINIFKENFILGAGFGDFQLSQTNSQNFYLADTSNYFARLLGYFGIFGLIYPLMLCYLFFKSINLLKYLDEEDIKKKVIYSIIISSAAIIPILIAFPSLVYFPISLILGLNFAYLSNISLRLESKN